MLALTSVLEWMDAVDHKWRIFLNAGPGGRPTPLAIDIHIIPNCCEMVCELSNTQNVKHVTAWPRRPNEHIGMRKRCYF